MLQMDFLYFAIDTMVRSLKRKAVLFSVAFALFARGQNVDADILRTLNRGEMPVWDDMMRGLSFAVPAVAPSQVACLWTVGLIAKDKKTLLNGHRSAATIILAMSLSTALKYTVRRTRPYDRYPEDIVQRDYPATFSFPSGHTTAAFASATALSLSYRKWYVVVPSYAYAGLVAYARMRLGVHYPTDVLTGMLIGTGSGYLIWELDRVVFGKRREKNKPAAPVVE
jgi:membrane-associated phospholipid phosphatase